MPEEETPEKEVGEAREIAQEDAKFLYHTSDNPAEEALMIHALIEKGMSQRKIAKETGLSPATITKRYKLLELPKELFQKILDGELKPSTAYQLTKLPEEWQKQFVGKEKITLDEVEKLRKSLVSKEVMELLEEDQPYNVQWTPCPHCKGSGRIKRRDLEDEA